MQVTVPSYKTLYDADNVVIGGFFFEEEIDVVDEGIQWAVDGLTKEWVHSRINKLNTRPMAVFNEDNADEYCQYCPSCKHTYEYELCTISGSDKKANTYHRILYHQLPKIGKHIAECPNCTHGEGTVAVAGGSDVYKRTAIQRGVRGV